MAARWHGTAGIGYQTTEDALSRAALGAVAAALAPGGALAASKPAAYLASCSGSRSADMRSAAPLAPYAAPLQDLLRATTIGQVYAVLGRLAALPVVANPLLYRAIRPTSGPPGVGGGGCPTATLHVGRQPLVATAPAAAAGGGRSGESVDPLALLVAAAEEGLLGDASEAGGLAAAGWAEPVDALAGADQFRELLAPLVAAAEADDEAAAVAAGRSPAEAGRPPYAWRVANASGGPLRLVAGVEIGRAHV